MSKIVPDDFLARMPGYLEKHPTAHAYLAFVMSCNLADVAARGLINARDEGALARIQGSEERGFPHGVYWNRLVAGEELTGLELSLASQPLMESLHGIAQKGFRKLYPTIGSESEAVPVKKVMSAAGRVVSELEKWLNAPVQNMKPSRFPASTDLIDRDRMMANQEGMWLVQLNGWYDTGLYGRGNTNNWHRILPEATSALSTESPSP